MEKKTIDQLKADLKDAQELLKNAKNDKEKKEAQELIDSVIAEAKELLASVESEEEKTAIQELIDSVTEEKQLTKAEMVQELINLGMKKTDAEKQGKNLNASKLAKFLTDVKADPSLVTPKKNTSSNSNTGSSKAKDTDKVKKAKEHLKIMNRYKTKELFLNSKDEVFTSQNFAELSEKDKTKVKKVTREAVENLIK